MLLVYGVWFLAMYFVVFIMLVYIIHRKTIFENKKSIGKGLPLISFVISAYNEEDKIGDTIKSLQTIDYPNMEFIIVNDGSMDNTGRVVKQYLNDKRFIFIDNKDNKGKAKCLNQGISLVKGKFVVTMDADSTVAPDVLRKTLPYFSDKKVGAVTVSIEVRDPKSILDKVIEVEYLLGLSLFLKIYSMFNCVFVTPGPFSIFRRSVLIELNSFDENNITEDMEIAYRIHEAGYKIKNCIGAKVKTIIPSNFKSLYVQRKRWYTGAIRTFFQHKNMHFKKKYGYFGFFLPYNFLLITLGLILFLYTTYLGATTFIENVWYYHYTDFNFFDHIFDLEFDILAFSSIKFIVMSSFIGILLIMFSGLKVLKIKFREKKIGILIYPFIYLIYQLFWLMSYITTLRKKSIKWR